MFTTTNMTTNVRAENNNIFERIGTDIDILILYKKPINKQNRKIVAEAFTSKGHFYIADTIFTKHSEEIKEKAKKIYNSKADYIYDKKKKIYKIIKNQRSDTNKFWVKCWECGRTVPPGKATIDSGGGWYCGC